MKTYWQLTEAQIIYAHANWFFGLRLSMERCTYKIENEQVVKVFLYGKEVSRIY